MKVTFLTISQCVSKEPFKFLLNILLFLCAWVLYTHVCLYITYMLCPQMPEHMGFHGTGVQLLAAMWWQELNAGPLQEQPGAFNH